MSPSNTGEVNTSMAGEKTHSLDGHEVEDVSSTAASSSIPITTEEVPRQIKTSTDPSTKQLEKLCDLMKEFRWDTSMCSEETSAQFQGPSRPRGEKFDTTWWRKFSR